MTTPRTIYTQEPGKYRAQKTVGGWVVIFVNEDRSTRNVDGGKLHKNRQNAYKKAKRLNDNLKASEAERFDEEHRQNTIEWLDQGLASLEQQRQDAEAVMETEGVANRDRILKKWGREKQ
jgi:hypothetical protein